MINAEQLIRVLLELDQQVLTSRPSAWGEAAELVRILCLHASPSLRNGDLMGNWEGVDMEPIRRPVSRTLHQPTMKSLGL